MEGVLVMLLFFAGIFSFVILFTKSFRKKIENNMKELAGRIGLEYHYSDPSMWDMFLKDPFPELKGRLDGEMTARIYVIVRGSGKSRIHYMALDIESGINHSNSLTLMHEGFFRKMGKMLGVQKDIEINDSEFDNHFIIKSDSSLYAKTVLSDSGLREKLMQDYRLLNNGELKFQNGVLHYEGIKSMYSKAEIDNMEAITYLCLALIKRLKQIKNQDFGEDRSLF